MKIQDHLVSLEFGFHLAEEEVIEDAVILMRVMNMTTGRRTFAASTTTHTDGIVTTGLLACGIEVQSGWSESKDNTDES